MEPNEALEQIQIIRDIMQKATRRFFFSPWQWIEWGILVIAGGALTLWMQATHHSQHLLLLWISLFIIGAVLESLIWAADAQRRGYDPLDPIHLKLWGIFLCLWLPGIIMTIVFVQLHLALYIIGLWLINISAAMFALVLLGDRKELILFGLLEFIGGILALTILLEQAIQLGMICFGLGGLLMGLHLLIKDKNENNRS